MDIVKGTTIWRNERCSWGLKFSSLVLLKPFIFLSLAEENQLVLPVTYLIILLCGSFVICGIHGECTTQQSPVVW